MEYRPSKSRLAEETNKAWGSEITLTETASSILKLVFYLQEFFAKKNLCAFLISQLRAKSPITPPTQTTTQR